MNAQDITQQCISTLYIIQYIYIHESGDSTQQRPPRKKNIL